MLAYFTIAIILFLLITLTIYPKVTIALESETTSISNNPPENTTTKIMEEDTNSLPGDYTPDQINAIIYRLYLLIQNSTSSEIGFNHDIAVLIDLVCSNELYENAVEACDIVTELSIESNSY